jgi:hypothetical protein
MTLLRASYQTSSQATETIVTVGVGAITAAARAVAELAESIPGTPVTARWPWLSASVDRPAAHEQPWLVSVVQAGRLMAAAVLIDDFSGTVRRTSLAGTAEGHRGALLARDELAAATLGRGLASALMGELREFRFGPLESGPALTELLNELPIGLIVDEVAVPIVRARSGTPPGMSHGTARTLRKAHNRITADGLRLEIGSTRQGPEITACLPLLESISRDRDHAGGRSSPLDDPTRRRVWQRRIVALGAAGILRLETLRLNGDLAAYVLGIDDGESYRVLEGRYVARWARYAPGRLLESAILDHVTDNERFNILDWMTAVAPETLLAANDTDQLLVIRGRT